MWFVLPAGFIGFVIGIRRPAVGLSILLVLSCTFPVVWDVCSTPYGTGSLSVADFLIAGLAVACASRARRADGVVGVSAALVVWLGICALVNWARGVVTVREVYRSIFRIGLYWVIPPLVRKLSDREVRGVIVLSCAVAIALSAVLLWTGIAREDAIWSFLQGGRAAAEVGFGGGVVDFSLGSSEAFRPITSGSFLVQMVWAYCVAALMIGVRSVNLRLMMTVVLLCTPYLVVTQSRHLVLFILATLGLSALVSGRRLRGWAWAGIVLVSALVSALWLIDPWRFLERLAILGRDESARIRVDDTVEAVSVLSQSPLWGIGMSKVHWLRTGRFAGGQDVHSLVAQGLLGGFVGIVLLLGFLAILGRVCVAIMAAPRAWRNHAQVALASVPGVVGAILISIAGATSVFHYPAAQTPFGLFAGLCLRPVGPQGSHALLRSRRNALPPCRPR